MTDNRSKEQSASPDAAAPPGITSTADSSGVGALTSNHPLVGSGHQYCVIHDIEGLCQLCLRDRTIERQAQEIERLRKALEQIRAESIIQGMSPSLFARAALEESK